MLARYMSIRYAFELHDKNHALFSNPVECTRLVVGDIWTTVRLLAIVTICIVTTEQTISHQRKPIPSTMFDILGAPVITQRLWCKRKVAHRLECVSICCFCCLLLPFMFAEPLLLSVSWPTLVRGGVPGPQWTLGMLEGRRHPTAPCSCMPFLLRSVPVSSTLLMLCSCLCVGLQLPSPPAGSRSP